MRFTVEERAARFQRRYTGPWHTELRELASVQLSARVRRHPRTEFVELGVAWHDLWTHALWRGTIVPSLLTILRFIERHLP
jgi:hypothetical protein